MAVDGSSDPGVAWLVYALLTVISWGLYGILLHTGQVSMADPVNGRYKAFLFVGVAYFVTAVLAPLAVLVAGLTGAVGAFGVLLAFGAKGSPAVVMSIVFAGAPIVNAVYSLYLHPPAGGIASIKPQFFLGILLAAVGGCLVTLYKPNPPVKKPQVAAATQVGPQQH